MEKRVIYKTFTKQIGELKRTLNVYKYDWGINAFVIDINCDETQTSTMRNFKYTSKSSTLDNLIDRALSYYKMK